MRVRVSNGRYTQHIFASPVWVQAGTSDSHYDCDMLLHVRAIRRVPQKGHEADTVAVRGVSGGAAGRVHATKRYMGHAESPAMPVMLMFSMVSLVVMVARKEADYPSLSATMFTMIYPGLMLSLISAA